MSILTRMLKQRAVYWAKDGITAFGTPKLATPIVIKCRWEDANEQFFLQNAAPAVSCARVYVDRNVELGGYLWLGPLDNSLSDAQILALAPASPTTSSLAYEIRSFGKTPKLRRPAKELRLVLV